MGTKTNNAPGLTASQVRALALEAGFTEAGVVALPYAAEARDAQRFRAWIDKGRAGTMRYLERKAPNGELAREHLAASFPWARSAIVCFASYGYPEAPLSTKTQNPRSGWMARYALSSRIDERGLRRPSDYHKVLLKRLKALEAKLHAQFGEFESRAYVDTGPVVERALAVAAGVGWIGKNTCLIHPQLGSWGFLAVLLTELAVSENPAPEGPPRIAQGGAKRNPGLGRTISPPPRRGDANPEISLAKGHDPSAGSGQAFSRADLAAKDSGVLAPPGSPFQIPDRCGTCTRCIEACPTHALDAPYQMDATRCISYLTIEHNGPIDKELMAGMGRQVFGCDICQDVCP